MSNSPKIKIYISCHKDCHVPNLNTFCPIYVGAAFGKPQPFPGILHDDTGDNISLKNKSYCELTAQYWAWKNDAADYYGFFHYRRYLSFARKKFPTTPFGEVKEEFNDDETLEKYGIDDKTIAELVKQYDIIAPEESGFPTRQTMYDQYAASDVHHASDLDFVLGVIQKDYPQIYPYAQRYMKRKKGYFCNMFIMKRDIFARYSAWLFDILQKHEQVADLSDYSEQAYRVHGYLAERLFGIYLYYLEHTTQLKILKLQRVLFENVDAEHEILPAFAHDNVPVILAANDFFVPYLSALLLSIKENASPFRNYDLLVLTKDISEKNKAVLQKQIDGENMRLRFIDVKKRIACFKNLPLHGHFREETYFRLLLPELLPSYSKMLYLDSDMIVCADVAELYDTPLDGFLLAACKDADMVGQCNVRDSKLKNYLTGELGLHKPLEYFQAGMILFNLDEFRRLYSVSEIMRFALSNEWIYLDQDVLNHFGQGKIKFVGQEWNVLTDWKYFRIKHVIANAPRALYSAYMTARKTPKIIHYAGTEKPWYVPDSDFADVFWNYSRRTPYYELVIYRMAGLQTDRVAAKRKKWWNNRLFRSVGNLLFPVGTKRRESLKKLLKIG